MRVDVPLEPEMLTLWLCPGPGLALIVLYASEDEESVHHHVRDADLVLLLSLSLVALHTQTYLVACLLLRDVQSSSCSTPKPVFLFISLSNEARSLANLAAWL